MIKISLQNSQLNDARMLFDDNPSSRDVVSWNMMIAGYIKKNHIDVARQMFDEMPQRDIVSWNTWISGLQKKKDHKNTYQCYLQIQSSGLRPTPYTFSIVISSVLGSVSNVLIPQLHAQIVSFGHYSSVYVGSALMRGYTDLEDHSALRGVFDDILDKDNSVWNALILGYMDLGFTDEAQRAFNKMPQKDVVSWTTMVDGYLKNNEVERARYVFDKMKEKNVVSWTAMISGYVGVDMCLALELFILMMKSGPRPNPHTFASILTACAKHSELRTGQQIHATIVKQGILVDNVLVTAFISMYAKCGDIEAAYCIFEQMPGKNLVSWNTILGCHARHGRARTALDEFEKMISSEVRPNNVTFTNILSACAHGGLVEEGEKVFYCMEKTYGIHPEKEHYACMVDLYGRAGHLDKAKSLIDHMPFEPDTVVWGALLAACGLHSDFEFGSNAADALHNLERNHPAAYMVLSKILGERGMWSSLTDIKQMEYENMKKQKAGSWIG
ncbi:pentatricopeptide repeat-containing protein At4g02750-like [Chenopodium quinoa]|uniref:Pentatricopeptide repeat-containing protein n=1 Tax=Chenopodium quinoa TaxID=63459 RepID=A0A803LF05_CHEQI|nr:pentatricopeptide repeat-containing protein At4g02750-like [Chenopodium quinoa]